MPYSYALKDMADWYRQLWAESLGKKFDLKGNEACVGPTPIKALGATDQHSQVQLYREGPNDKLFTFLQVDNHGERLKIGPAPECAAELGYLAGKDLGTLLNNEVTTSFAGALFGINPYDQPAVELGKEATFALMGKEGYENFAQEIQAKTEIDEDYLV
ncbi:MAG: hypothetical protein ACYS74_13785 [Planctomycetota bacterium]|jgi:glucose-6-phosphate isomerase